MTTKLLTAASPEGRRAVEAVIAAAHYRASVDDVPPAWALARVVDGVPVSFILVDPEREMAFPGGGLPYAFINDVATHEDRRREGHFRALMTATFERLRAAGIPAVLTHGRYPLYRRFGFDVFTHHCGVFVTPAQIERTLGLPEDAGRELLEVDTAPYRVEGRLLVTGVDAPTFAASARALRAAAALAQAQGKDEILFEHPPAPSYGSRYPIHPTLETPFVTMARTCGARVVVQGADPERGAIPDADWIKVLDAAGFVRAAVAVLPPAVPLPRVSVGFDTDAGALTLHATPDGARVTEGRPSEGPVLAWPSAALAHLVTGYRSAALLCALHATPLPDMGLMLLDLLFPPVWRLSRNESWTYRA